MTRTERDQGARTLGEVAWGRGARRLSLAIVTDVPEGSERASARLVRRATARRASSCRATARKRQGDTQTNIVDFLVRNPRSTVGGIAKSLGINRTSVSARLTQLANAGRIEESTHGNESGERGFRGISARCSTNSADMGADRGQITPGTDGVATPKGVAWRVERVADIRRGRLRESQTLSEELTA
jgi:hypothetical protein